jgi:predicted CopG family antitoxin
LTREKRGGESFTSLLRRLLDQRPGVDEAVGAWGPSGERSDLSAVRELRKSVSRVR